MKHYELWYKQEAPFDGEDFVIFDHRAVWRDERYKNDGWEKWSLPLGNGYMGVNVFGRTETERLQVTENSLSNPWTVDDVRPTCNGGLQNFCDIFLDFGHKNVKKYRRGLCLNTAIAYTEYECDGVKYERRHFASYPDKAFITKLWAEKERALSFTIRSEIPFCAPYLLKEGDGMGRTGNVCTEGNKIILSGKMDYYGIEYEGQISVNISGGELITHEKSIEVKSADSAIIIIAVGTNYKMESRVFMEPDPKKKLAPYAHPHEMVTEIIDKAEAREYGELLVRHLKDYGALISRAEVDFGGEAPDITTDALIKLYGDGGKSEHARYLEELYFTYGRYLLIASSRPGTYPANLQGTWSKYASAPWSSGYWHNINVQMNYWPAFNTNLHELFLPYLEYFKAYRAIAEHYTNGYVAEHFPEQYTEKGNGISIGTAAWLYKITGISAPRRDHSGPGTSAFTAKLFTDYYEFSLDEAHLEDAIYPANRGVAEFLSKTLEEQEDGKLLVKYSESPEQRHGENKEYYHTKGCAFDQQMVYECYKDTVMLADKMGVSDEFTKQITSDLERLDPVQIGASGQIKEYREEVNYGDIGEYNHRHISHLVGLYPGTVINGNKPEWIAAAQVSLDKRGDVSTGWSTAHKMNAWARTKNGERAHDLLEMLLAKCTLPNLWDSHPPFQIDGNFGGTAGIAEMLLQSHEGYLHILPALPSVWESGSFTGLSARGGYTVSASWRNGKIIKVTVSAKRDGKIKICLGDTGRYIEKKMEKEQTLIFTV
jgi:hypothetical protein